MAEQNIPKAAETSAAQGLDNRLRAVQEQIQSYYSNCAMLATTPLDISVYFGRLIPVNNEKGEQGLAEYYERQITVTVEQAKKIAQALAQTVQMMESRREQPVMQAPTQPEPQAVSRTAPRPVAQNFKAALITDDADLELEVPLGDLEDTGSHPGSAVSRTSRMQMPAQAASAPRDSSKIEL